MDDQSFQGTCPTCGQRFHKTEIERLHAVIENEAILTREQKAEIGKLYREIEILTAERDTWRMAYDAASTAG